MGRLLNIGFGNVVNTDKVVLVVNPEAAPIKRLIQGAKGTKDLIDATQGRRTKAVIVTSEQMPILSALTPETIARRFEEVSSPVPKEEKDPES
ncbi:MAG: DUF370 domain-containing protein [Blautia sp.]|nr:DUF370 domain-containing protein [Blautia sp.]